MRRRELKQAFWFAAAGAVIYFVFSLKGNAFCADIWRVGPGQLFILSHSIFDSIGRTFPQIADYVHGYTIIGLALLTGATLGIVLWVIIRLGITPYIALVRDRRSHPTMRF